jgi:serine/threonine protein kinase
VERFTFQPTIHGAGGFAKIIRGRDNELERDIAVKVLDQLATEFGEEDRIRFRREARILAKLSHPNVPSIYDIQFSTDHFLIVFQFIEGKTLREIINESGPVPMALARRWFHQLASALEHAHKLGIVHRDVKPDNIIITPDQDSAYLVDFGIAITMEDSKKLTKSGYVVGTAGYMSPEQHRGDPVDYKTDIFSLGVTLYEALSGKPLPVGSYAELSTANETIPPQIDDLILACLEPQKTRIDSARTFSNQLEGALKLPSKPLSEVLTRGRLHEVAVSLDALSANDIANLPPGQRYLIVSKVADILSSRDENLEYPAATFLEMMLTKGILLPRDDYREIVAPAIVWAFERQYSDGRVGRAKLREALETAAFIAHADTYGVLSEEFINFLNKVSLDERENRYLQGLREIITALMANLSCSDSANAANLNSKLRSINKISRDRVLP